MSLRLVFLDEFGKAFVPKRFIPTLRKYLLKANISPIPYNFFGALFYVTTFLTALIYIFLVYPKIKVNPFILLGGSFLSWVIIQGLLVFVIIIIIVFYLDMKIYFRTKQLEEMLPDFLTVVSSNLKGGMSFENSLWAGIKPRFKALAVEMAEVSKRVMTGYEIDKALIEFSEKYNSQMLKRALDLIISEIESGGDIARLVDRVIEDMKKTKQLKDDMAASALSYVLFISVIVVLIAPLLFALSYSLLIILSNFMAKVSTSTGSVSNMPFQFGEVTVNIESFKYFSMTALGVISLFSAMIVSIVEKGSIKTGIKYIPFFITCSVLLYLLFMKLLSAVFSTLYAF